MRKQLNQAWIEAALKLPDDDPDPATQPAPTVAALRRLSAEGTEAPWSTRRGLKGLHDHVLQGGPGKWPICVTVRDDPQTLADLALIVALRNGIDDLLDALDAATTAQAALVAERDTAQRETQMIRQHREALLRYFATIESDWVPRENWRARPLLERYDRLRAAVSEQDDAVESAPTTRTN